MANRSKRANHKNHDRQAQYLAKGIVMLPTLREEKKSRKRKGETDGQKDY